LRQAYDYWQDQPGSVNLRRRRRGAPERAESDRGKAVDRFRATMVWRRERQHTAHVHRIHEARAVPSAAVRRPSTSLPEPNAAREAAQRARRSSQLQRHGRDSRHLKGRLPQNLVRIQTTRSEARQGQPGQEVRRREQCRAAARRERGPPFAALPITTHMPARHGHTPLQAPDFDLRRREGGRKERRRIDRRGRNRPLRTGRL